MIRIQIDPKSIDEVEKLILSKADQARETIGPAALTEIAKAVFVLTSKQFLRDLSAAAIQDPSKYHHLYEWNAIGNKQQKLFRIRRAGVAGGKLTIAFEPLKSTKPVPSTNINPEYASQHIFRDKMKVMEAGQPIQYRAQTTLAFSPDHMNMVFVPRGTVINIMHPGGIGTKNSLKTFSSDWYANSAKSIIMQSRLIQNIGSEVAKTLNKKNSTKNDVRAKIKAVASKYSNNDAVTF